MQRRVTPFDDALIVAAPVGYLATLALYSYAAPTLDIRARLPWLLGYGGWAVALLFGVVYVGLGSLGHWAAAGRWDRGATGGIAVAAAANLAVLESGLAATLLPAVRDEDPALRWIHALVWAGLAAVVVLVMWKRHRVRHGLARTV